MSNHSKDGVNSMSTALENFNLADLISDLQRISALGKPRGIF